MKERAAVIDRPPFFTAGPMRVNVIDGWNTAPRLLSIGQLMRVIQSIHPYAICCACRTTSPRGTKFQCVTFERSPDLMSKRIVYCSDGTWQNAVNNTNVYR